MLRKTVRTASLGGASVIALTIGLAQTAGAQDKPGFHLGVQGYALWSSGTSRDLNGLSVRPGGDGEGAKITAGYRFSGPWSLEANVSGNWLQSTSDQASTTFPIGRGTGTSTRKLSSRTDYYLADFDAGYTIQLGEGRDIRLTGGVQYGNFRVKRDSASFFSYAAGQGPVFATASNTDRKSSFWGVGPKLGLDGHYRLGRSDFSIVGGVSGSVLFGRLTNSNSYYSYPGGSSSGNSNSKSQTAYGLNANVGLAYQLPYANFDSSITVGMQVDQWWHIAEQPSTSGNGMQNVNLTTWGPLLRWDTHF